jgi:hypothetical protein
VAGFTWRPPAAPPALIRSGHPSIARLQPALLCFSAENIPRPAVPTVNHYSRPGFCAWWIALGISAVIPAEVHWVVTAAWTFPGRWWRRYAAPLSGWVLRQAAGVYGFTSTPPMPPEPHEYARRAWAVRRVLSYAHQAERPLIGLAPEAGTVRMAGWVLRRPAPGVSSNCWRRLVCRSCRWEPTKRRGHFA